MAIQNVISLYNKALEENTHLYNGMEYIGSHPYVSGSAFWRTDTLQEGSIYYDGVFYPNIFLAYDAAKEEVVIKNRQRTSIKLLPEKINYFNLLNQLFVHITSDSTNNYGFKSGWYNILYDGVVTVLAKRRKVALRVLTPTDHYEFREQSFYFINKDGRYYAVDTKSALFTALHDKKEEIKKFVQKNKLNFKKDLENTLIKTADYYSQLKK